MIASNTPALLSQLNAPTACVVARKNTRLEPRLSLILEVLSSIHSYMIANFDPYRSCVAMSIRGSLAALKL